jgi:adenosylcobinamide kinase/adenosylcobinamide-phosphate guanylyltransferase
MKILYIGGQKSGKTLFAIKKTIKIAKETKPFYLATYDNSFNDKEMTIKIRNHKKERGDNFISIEEPLKLLKIIKNNRVYVIDCINMWILNMMMKKKSANQIIKNIKKIMKKKANIIFVLNDLSKGVIPNEKFSREYIDLVGLVGQVIAKKSDSVYSVNYGIKSRIK